MKFKFGDFVVELSNIGFYTQAQVDKDVQWSRRVGVNSRSPKASTILPPTLRRISDLGSEI
jgi:hypothetical protein